MAFYDFLPSVQPTLIDTPLVVDTQDSSPRVLVIGTAEKGASFSAVPVASTSSARSTFGAGGTLLRGIYEVKAQGARNVVAMRVGGTPAILADVGGSGGYTITTDLYDDAAGARYAVWYTASSGRLAVYDSTLGEWVYDSTGVLASTSLGVTVTVGLGFTGGDSDIGTASAPVAMSAVSGTPTYTAGTDGTGCVLTKMWEQLYDAYQLLDFAEFDIVVPMCVHLNDLNIADMASSEITSRALAALGS
jgi:hypothetical protein